MAEVEVDGGRLRVSDAEADGVWDGEGDGVGDGDGVVEDDQEWVLGWLVPILMGEGTTTEVEDVEGFTFW